MNVSYDEAEPEEEYEPMFDVDYYVPDFKSLYDFAGEKEILDWMKKWRQMRYVDEPDHVVKEWFQNLRKIHGPHVIGYEECTMKFHLYDSEWDSLPRFGKVLKEGDYYYEDCPPPKPKWVELEHAVPIQQNNQLMFLIFTCPHILGSSLCVPSVPRRKYFLPFIHFPFKKFLSYVLKE